MPWFNADGLQVKLGIEEGVAGRAGEYEFDGPIRVTEVVIDGTAVPTADTVLDFHAVIPKGARIEKVDVYVQTAFTSGGAATLNVGGFRTDTNAVDATGGIISALALASLNADGKSTTLTQGSTSAGTYIGVNLARNVLLSTKWTTAAYTAGKAYVRIWWSQYPVA